LKFGLIIVTCLKYYVAVQEIPYDRFRLPAAANTLAVLKTTQTFYQ
jgi:hypothetical protein